MLLGCAQVNHRATMGIEHTSVVRVQHHICSVSRCRRWLVSTEMALRILVVERSQDQRRLKQLRTDGVILSVMWCGLVACSVGRAECRGPLG